MAIQTGGAGTYTTAVMHIDTIAVGGPGVIDDAGTPDTGSHDTGTSTDSGTTLDAPVDMPSDSTVDDAVDRRLSLVSGRPTPPGR